jgi:hypothetical protein
MRPTCKFSALPATTAPPRVPQAYSLHQNTKCAQLVITALPAQLPPLSARLVTILSLRVRRSSLIVTSVHPVQSALEVVQFLTKKSQRVPTMSVKQGTTVHLDQQQHNKLSALADTTVLKEL